MSPDARLKLRDAHATWQQRALTEALRAVVHDELRRFLHGAPTGDTPRYLSTAEAARRVSVHAATIRAWISQGVLRSYRAGREIRVRVDELDAALARMGAEGAAEIDLDAAAEAIVARGRKR